MNRFSFIAGALSIGLLSASCEKEADFGENNYTPKLVVNSLFNSDSIWRVDISKSHYILDDASTFIEDALVLIYEDGVLLDSLDYHNPPGGGHSFYQAIGAEPIAGKEYTLKVEKEGFNTIVCKSRFPYPPNLGQTDIKDKTFGLNNRFEGDLTVELNDPQGEQNYYHVMVRRANWQDPTSPTPDSYAREYFTLEDFPEAIEGYNEGFLFKDDGFNGGMKTITCKLNTIYDPARFDEDHFILEVRAVTHDYYEYSRTVYEQKHAPYNKFVEIHSNVEGGLGIFAGFNVVSTKLGL